MPRNAQGLYTLPAGNPVVPGTIIESVWANDTMSDLADAMTGSLPRNGSAPMTGPLTLNGATPTSARHAVDKSYVDKFIAFASGFPVGAVTAYAGATAPPGYLECNGSAVSRTTYADLFAAIGTTYGVGDSSTTFNVPDMRDEFIRGKSAARAVGSKQSASLAAHTHPTSDPGHGHLASQVAHSHTIATGGHSHTVIDPGHIHYQPEGLTNGPYGSAPNGGSFLETSNVPSASASTGISVAAVGDLGGSADSRQPAVTVTAAATGLSIGAAGGDETRPQNIAQIYIIKAVQDSSGPVPITGITTSDAQMISVDNTNPVVPELLIHSNVAFGTVKLDAGGKVPLNQMPTSSQQLLGYFDASSGQNPTEKYPTQTFNSGDTYIISVSGSITVFDPVTLVASLTPVSAGNLLQFVTGSVSNPTGWYYAVQSTTVIASQVGFTPAAGISATDVQAAIVEVQGNIPINATEVPFTPSGTIAASNTQAAIAELDSETQAALALKSSITTTVTKDSGTGAANLPAGAQIERPTVPAPGMLRFNSDSSGFEGFNGTIWAGLGAANASSVAFTPVGSVSATNVQSAIAEVDSEKVAGAVSGALVLVKDSVGANALEIDQTAKTIKGINGYVMGGNGPAFSATRNAGDVLTANTPVAINNFTKVFDTNSNFNPTNGRFTPTVAGYYQVNAQAVCLNAVANIGIYTSILKNGAIAARGGGTCNISTFGIGAASGVIYLNGTSDYLTMAVTFTASSGTGTVGDIAFSAALVRGA